MERAGARIDRPVRRIVRRDEQHLVELERRARGVGRVEMAEVNRDRTCRRARRDAARPSCVAAQPSRGESRSAASSSLGAPAAAAAARTAAISRHAASSSASTPSPVAPEILWNGSRGFVDVTLEARRARSGSSSASILLAATICGLAATCAIEQPQLVDDRVEVLDRIAARRAGDVDEMDEHLRPLDVAQELVAESVAFVRALDQPGHVGDDEAAIVARA